MRNIIIFTDLDGTLLDHSTYSFEAAVPALNKIKEMNIPLVVCSSKTKREIELYRQKLNNNHPFISENGGGIFIPKDYFRFEIADSGFKIVEIDNYLIIRLGAEYNELRNAIGELRKAGFKIMGFGDMTVEEISKLTGLDDQEAIMAKERDFDEPFVFEGNKEEMASLFESIRAKGLRHTQGEFFHIIGDSDKGRAVKILIELYRRLFNDLLTVAIGDSLNDVPMLEVVDYPIIVQRLKGNYDSQIKISNLIKAEGIGPIGWNNAILKILSVLN
ncbi:MAG: HAD-IIB family hydrolase [Nitrospirae bacterium]|nr:HAD-IIB family hydrolase [Nitrospirota bacterium]